MRKVLTAASVACLGAFATLAACGVEPVFFNLEQTDRFTQEVRRQVDILLVVDNSCSMVDEQIKLARNFDNFIDQFLEAEVDYQIGVVTTDMTDTTQAGRLVGETKIVDSTMDLDTARSTFEDNVKVCATGSGFERGLAAAEAALSEPIISNENAGFLRDDAALSIVFVSDEEDGSAIPTGEYLDFFKGLKGDRGYRDDTLINLSAVVGEPPDGCEQPNPFVPICNDGLDDDGDGLIDCDDPDCATAWECTLAFPESDCGDGVDNDGDGATDCEDADCGIENTCRESECSGGVDDDGDGDVDCEDIDCLVDQPELCGELSCDDEGLEHHGDNPYPNLLPDCRDPSCFATPETEEACLQDRAEIDYADRCEVTVQLNEFLGTLTETDGRDVDSTTSLDAELEGCDDPDCATFWLCQPGLSIEPQNACGDCIDNDNDGLEDCDDRDCLDSEFCNNPYPIEAGTRYIDVSNRSGGIVTSICAEEFSGLVRELGLNISGLRSIFYLTAWPRIETLAVYLGSVEDGNRLESGWEYDPVQNRIVFQIESLPPEGTDILVNYTRSPDPPTTQTEESE